MSPVNGCSGMSSFFVRPGPAFFQVAAETALFDSGTLLGFYAGWQRSQQRHFTSDSSKWSLNPPVRVISSTVVDEAGRNRDSSTGDRSLISRTYIWDGREGKRGPYKKRSPIHQQTDPCDLQYNDRPLQRRSPSHQPSQPANAAVGSNAPAAAGVTQGRKSQIPGGIGAAGPMGRAGPAA